MKKIVFTGGGTAGHIYPALAIIEKIQSKYKVSYIGSNGMEQNIIKNTTNIPFYKIDAVKLERKFTLKNFLIPFKLLKSIISAKKILKNINPDIIFSKGGFVSVPVVIAGKLLKIPIISHESDLSLGLANKIILPCCNVMCTSFKETCKSNKKCVYTGQPIREKIFHGNKKNLTCLDAFDKNKRNILIVGGSSGAKFINDIIKENISQLSKKYNIIHITGKNNLTQTQATNYQQIEYANNIEDFLNWSNIVISRAGSGAINEFLALKKPMLLIPLSKRCSRGDQIENAKLFAKNDLALVMEEENYSSQLFQDNIANLIKNSDFYIKNMKKTHFFNACDKIIDIIEQIQN